MRRIAQSRRLIGIDLRNGSTTIRRQPHSGEAGTRVARLIARRAPMHWASWTNAIIGLWLFVSPWIFGAPDLNATRNNMLFGFLIVALALPSAAVPARVHAFAWTNVA